MASVESIHGVSHESECPPLSFVKSLHDLHHLVASESVDDPLARQDLARALDVHAMPLECGIDVVTLIALSSNPLLGQRAVVRPAL